MRLAKLSIMVILAVCFLGMTACGYSINEPIKFPGGVKTVYVKVFKNESLETGLETMIATSLVSEISRLGAEQLTATSEQADAVIQGSIRAASAEDISRVGINVAAERRAILYVDAQLVAKNGTVLWQVRNMAVSESYLVFEDKANTESSKYYAYGIISKRIAERIYGSMSEERF